VTIPMGRHALLPGSADDCEQVLELVACVRACDTEPVFVEVVAETSLLESEFRAG